MQRMRNYTAETFANPQPGQKRKRQRDFTSCKLCRDRKVACDRARPACATCVSRKCASSCTYDDANGEANGRDTATNATNSSPSVAHPSTGSSTLPRQTSSNSSTSDSPQNLDGVIVEYLNKKGYSIAGDARQQAVVPSEPTSTQIPGDTSKEQTGGRISRLEGLVDALAARVDTLESTSHSGLNRQSAKSSNPYSNAILDGKRCPESSFYIGQHSWSTAFSRDLSYLFTMRETFAQQWSDLQSLNAHFEGPRRKGLWHFVNLKTNVENSTTALLALIPEESLSIEMLARFYKTFNVMFPIIDEASFNRQVTAFWTNEASPSPTWLALFLAIIALGFQMPISGKHSALEANHPNGRRRGKWLMGLATQHAIKLADAARRPTLTIFQTFLVIILQEKLAMDWVDGNDMTSGLLGMLSRLAFTIGLHRDPSLNTSMSAEDIALRRNVFWTYVYLDFEHSLHAGTPWPIIEGDVEIPKKSNGWLPYMAWIARGIPLYAQVLQLSHSRRIDVSVERLSSLQDQLEELHREFRHSRPDEAVAAHSQELRLVSAIQQASCQFLHERVCIVMHFPLLEIDDTIARIHARTMMFESANRMLDEIVEVNELLSKIPTIYQRGWKHFVLTTLRCHLHTACAVPMIILRRTAGLDAENHINSLREHCISRIKNVMRLLGFSLALSGDSIKNQAMVWAQFRSLLAQSASSSDEIIRDTSKFDPASGSGIRLITAAQEGMETVIQMARDAIAEARESHDPPPYLLAEEIKVSQPAVQLPIVTASEPTFIDALTDDWLQEFDLLADPGLDGMPGF